MRRLMEKPLDLLLAVVLLSATAAPAAAEIGGSVHDFSSEGWSNSEACVVCHTPHEADTAASGAPLWNHRLTTQSFTVYSSATLDAVVGQPTGSSKLCLSCHDGSVALDSFGTSVGAVFIPGRSTIGAGADLSNDHPISFVYDSDLAGRDRGLFDPTTAPSGLGRSVSQDLLDEGRLECVSCHDVHAGSTENHLLRVTLARSSLCQTCHNM